MFFNRGNQGGFKEVTVQQAQEMLGNGDAVLIDVREPYEYVEVHAKDARLIPLSTFPQHLNEIPQDKDVLLICRSGARSAQAAMIANQGGLKRLFNVQGGTLSWVQAKLPTEKGK
jgi:rhodanese-related sulfurtransferase